MGEKAYIIDPICTYIFSVIIVFTTFPIFKECVQVIMEGTPQEVDSDQLLLDICEVEGVEEVHDFHIWSISVGKYALSAHIISEHPHKTLNVVTDLCRRKYQIFHSTIQCEGGEANKYRFKCDNDIHE